MIASATRPHRPITLRCYFLGSFKADRCSQSHRAAFSRLHLILNWNASYFYYLKYSKQQIQCAYLSLTLAVFCFFTRQSSHLFRLRGCLSVCLKKLLALLCCPPSHLLLHQGLCETLFLVFSCSHIKLTWDVPSDVERKTVLVHPYSKLWDSVGGSLVTQGQPWEWPTCVITAHSLYCFIPLLWKIRKNPFNPVR